MLKIIIAFAFFTAFSHSENIEKARNQLAQIMDVDPVSLTIVDNTIENKTIWTPNPQFDIKGENDYIFSKNKGMTSESLIRSYWIDSPQKGFMPFSIYLLKKGTFDSYLKSESGKDHLEELKRLKKLNFSSDSARMLLGSCLLSNQRDKLHGMRYQDKTFLRGTSESFIGYDYVFPELNYDVRILFFFSCFDYQNPGVGLSKKYNEFYKSVSMEEIMQHQIKEKKREKFQFVDELVDVSRDHLFQNVAKKRPINRFQNLKNAITHPENEHFWLWLLGIFVLLSAISGWMWKRFLKKSP